MDERQHPGPITEGGKQFDYERDRRKQMLATVDKHMARATQFVEAAPEASIAQSLLALLTLARMHERFSDDD